MGCVYAIASGKGGTGKTTVAAGLACAFSQLGKSVCAVDMDAGLANLDLALGVDGAVFNVSDALSGVELDDALVAVDGFDGISFLAAPEEAGDNSGFPGLVRKLASAFDVVILDAPAGIGPFVRLAAYAADCALIVSSPDTPSLRDASAAADALEECGVRDIRLVLNRVSKKLVKRKHAYNVDQSMDLLGARLAGLIFEDGDVRRAAHACVPLLLYKKRGAARDVRDIASRLDNLPVEPRV